MQRRTFLQTSAALSLCGLGWTPHQSEAPTLATFRNSLPDSVRMSLTDELAAMKADGFTALAEPWLLWHSPEYQNQLMHAVQRAGLEFTGVYLFSAGQFPVRRELELLRELGLRKLIWSAPVSCSRPLSTCLDHCGSLGLRLLLEPAPVQGGGADLPAVARLCRELDHPACGWLYRADSAGAGLPESLEPFRPWLGETHCRAEGNGLPVVISRPV